MSLNQSAGSPPLVSRSAAREAIREALKLYVGRGRRYSVKRLSNGTGVPDRLIECAICDPESGDYRPLCIENLLSIAAFLGEQFTTEWLRLAGQGAFVLPEEDIPPPGQLAADCANDTAEVTSRAADGAFCEEDKRELASVGHRKIVRGMGLVAQAGRRSAVG